MSNITVIVMNVADEFDDAITAVEEQVASEFEKTPMGKQYTLEVDDFATIDTIAEEWQNFAYGRPNFPRDEDLLIFLTFNDEPDGSISGILKTYERVGANIVVGCTLEQRQGAAFQAAWQKFELGLYNPWLYMHDLARWSIIPA
jgi:hypothetical protein